MVRRPRAGRKRRLLGQLCFVIYLRDGQDRDVVWREPNIVQRTFKILRVIRKGSLLHRAGLVGSGQRDVVLQGQLPDQTARVFLQVLMVLSHLSAAEVVVHGGVGRTVEITTNQSGHVAARRGLDGLDQQMGLPQFHVRRSRITKNVGVNHAQLVACTMSVLHVPVLQDNSQGNVAFGESLVHLLLLLLVPHVVRDFLLGKPVVVEDSLLHSLKPGDSPERRAALAGVLPTVEDRISLLLLEQAVVAIGSQLRLEPLVEGILLDLLQGDDVCAHGLHLLDNEVFSPIPAKRPLLTVGVNVFRGVKVGQDVPVKDLELLLQPLRIEGSTVADHLAHAGFLWRRDDRPCRDCHLPLCLLPTLGEGNDVQAKGSLDVVLRWAVLTGIPHLCPLRNRILCFVLLRLRVPGMLWQSVPSSKETLSGAVVSPGLGHIADCGHLMRMVKARLNSWTAHPSVLYPLAAALVFKPASIAIFQGHINRHLGYHDRPVPSNKLCSLDVDHCLTIILVV
mmetsp:Transcript_48449/g.113468  ORF Transcript_48449/g.113468 Transcript_48449/m.113468 type:complete len:507 (-) Transcript_48449:121-1641(-)